MKVEGDSLVSVLRVTVCSEPRAILHSRYLLFVLATLFAVASIETNTAPPNDQEFNPIFKRHFDIYGLGVVLFKVAYWKPIYKVLEVEATRGYDPKFTKHS